MINIKINGDTAIFEVEGWDKLWSFKSSLEIPVTHITNVYADPNYAMNWLDGFKLIGTSIPTIFRAGTFYQDGELVFWDVHHAEDTIVVELKHEQLAKLVIEVSDPMDAVAVLKNAISKQGN
jgi:hypothetical protein